MKTIEEKILDSITRIAIEEDSAGIRYLTLGHKIYKIKESDTLDSLMTDIEGFVNMYNDHDEDRPRVYGTHLEGNLSYAPD